MNVIPLEANYSSICNIPNIFITFFLGHKYPALIKYLKKIQFFC